MSSLLDVNPRRCAIFDSGATDAIAFKKNKFSLYFRPLRGDGRGWFYDDEKDGDEYGAGVRTQSL